VSFAFAIFMNEEIVMEVSELSAHQKDIALIYTLSRYSRSFTKLMVVPHVFQTLSPRVISSLSCVLYYKGGTSLMLQTLLASSAHATRDPGHAAGVMGCLITNEHALACLVVSSSSYIRDHNSPWTGHTSAMRPPTRR